MPPCIMTVRKSLTSSPAQGPLPKCMDPIGDAYGSKALANTAPPVNADTNYVEPVLTNPHYTKPRRLRKLQQPDVSSESLLGPMFLV